MCHNRTVNIIAAQVVVSGDGRDLYDVFKAFFSKYEIKDIASNILSKTGNVFAIGFIVE